MTSQPTTLTDIYLISERGGAAIFGSRILYYMTHLNFFNRDTKQILQEIAYEFSVGYIAIEEKPYTGISGTV